MYFTVDTGAGKTIISKEIFFKIPRADRPKLQRTTSLRGAGGKPIGELGEAVFELQLGTLTVKKRVVVAEIEDDGLLGADILQQDRAGPADILLSQGIIKFRDTEIPCIQVGLKNRTRQVYAADNYEIPGYTEAVIDVHIDRFEEDDFTLNTEVVIEPTSHFADTYPLMMANSIVELRGTPTVKVRMMNPYATSVSIRQNTHIGQAESYDEDIEVLTTAENPVEENDQNYLRRINLPETQQFDRVDIPTYTGKDSLPTHLQEMYERASDGKNHREQQIIAATLEKYKDAFSKDDTDLGLTHLAEHTIDTGEARPVKQPPRRVPLAFADEERKAIEQLEKQNVIRKSNSPWASPIVLVRKKNGKVRPCVDYRRLNSVTRNDAFPLPRMLDCLDAVAGSMYFSTFDLTSGYHQIPVKEDDIHKTAFVTKYGLYEFTAMPFGLTNAPATFQRVMELALQGLQWLTCLIYLDDVIVFSPTFDSHIQRVSEVLDRILQANLKLKPEKCHLLQPEVEFLGHIVSQRGVSPNKTNVSKILEFPTPTNVTEVRQILGMGSYYRRFVKSYSDLVRPMTELTKKGVTFKWTAACEEALQTLKSILTGPEIMAYPLSEGGEFILDCDASGVAIGAVLSQKQGNEERVIAYASRSLNKAEKNYCVTDKELLALRYFVEYFRQYLLGRHFLIRTDHQALVWLFSLKEPKSRIARWLEILSAYNFSIEHRAGRRHGNADFMSRCPQPGDCRCSDVDTLEILKCGPCHKCKRRAEDMQSSLRATNHVRQVKTHIEKPSVIGSMRGWFCFLFVMLFTVLFSCVHETFSQTCQTTLEKLAHVKGTCQTFVKKVTTRASAQKGGGGSDENLTPWAGICTVPKLMKMQEDDPDIGPVLAWMKNKQRPKAADVVTCTPATRHYLNLWDSLRVHDGLLHRSFHRRDGTGSYLQLLVPQEMKKDVLRLMHDSVLAGHLGSKKTRQRILISYYWFELREDVRSWVLRCDVCASSKMPTQHPRAPLGSMQVGAPMDRLCTDLLGPLPLTPRNNRYILLVTDQFTKWVEIFPVSDQTASTCAHKILTEVISRYGCPIDLHSDQGRNYESDLFKALCNMLEIRKTRTAPRNPKCNGQVERFNRTLLNMIKAYLKDEQTDWDLHLGCLAGAYRATVHESTGLSPNLLMLGREVRMPAEVVYSSGVRDSKETVSNYGSYVDSLRSKLQLAHAVARKHLSASATRQKQKYDVKTCLNVYKPGDPVWLLMENRKLNVCPKLQPSYEGPHVIVAKLNDIDYVLQKEYKGKQIVVNHNKLKPYHGENPPVWGKKMRKSH